MWSTPNPHTSRFSQFLLLQAPPPSESNPFRDDNTLPQKISVDQAPPPSRMKHKDIESVFRTYTDAFKSDPSTRYLQADGHSKILEKANGLGIKASLHRRVSKHSVDYVIKNGISFAWLQAPPSQNAPPGLPDRRAEEARTKEIQATEEFLGAIPAEAFYLAGLGTMPDFQGRGYASTLVEKVLQHVDAAGRYTCLGSIDYNVGFYELFGFKSVGGYTLGDDNPTWTEDPVAIHLMVRPPVEEKDSKNEKSV